MTNFCKLVLSLFLLLFAFSFSADAQILKPATWSTGVSDKQVKVGDKIDLIFYVDIKKDWYLYSTDFDPDLGPMVTEFNFEPDPSYQLVGDIKPVGAKKKYDSLWEGEYTYFRDKAEFRQTIKILETDLNVEGSYAYQVCTDVDGKCIPFNDSFAFNGIEVISTGKENKNDSESEKAARPVKENDVGTSAGVSPKNQPEKETKKKEIEKEETGTSASLGGNNPEPEKLSSGLTKRASTDPYSLLGFMFFAFLGGLAALLTPCVFPMIPMTVAFFSNHSKNRRQAIQKALMYGLSLVLIYTVIGIFISVVFGATALNNIATSATANIIFFIIFVVFALSFFGLFEITLPNKFVNNIDKKSDKGGYIGIFFMALTLAVVSFSCTAPIAGGILVEASRGQIIKPAIGMFGFSMAFAIPFTLFAVFPEWLKRLPKSGGWLNTVKVVLGFLELALAFKFLSIADLVYHWGILDRDTFLIIWITIFSFLGFYLLGKIRLPHDSELKVISVPRLVIAIGVFSFVVYLIPGLFGAPLKALAGYLPPMYTHDYNLAAILKNDSPTVAETDELCEDPKYADFLHFPHGIKGYFDYEQALACAKEKNKPVFIDFTGHGCVNCRKMEATVWSDPEVLKRLKNDFVMVALYVDEKTKLPESEWYISDYDDEVKKTIGSQNADFQITRFNNNAQPFYVIVSPDGEMLTEPEAYNTDVQNFIDFLDEGLESYEKKMIADYSGLSIPYSELKK